MAAEVHLVHRQGAGEAEEVPLREEEGEEGVGVLLHQGEEGEEGEAVLLHQGEEEGVVGLREVGLGG